MAQRHKYNRKRMAKVKKPTVQFMLNFKSSIEAKLSWQNGKYRKIDGIFL